MISTSLKKLDDFCLAVSSKSYMVALFLFRVAISTFKDLKTMVHKNI